MNHETIENFRKNLRGAVIGRSDPGYDEARKLYNGMIDKRPLLVARCADAADVIAAVNFGREQAIPIAVRGGGHNGPGLGSVDDGLMIDLSTMRGVRVDPGSRTVRVEPGCTSGDVDHATHAFGLAVPFGIISTTGVAGLSLGGGTGYLTRKFGLTIDNLIEADVVLADGTFVTASRTDNPDLLWALKGGGGNFGVVTSFLFQAHPVRMVFAGPMAWDQSQAGAILRAYRDFLPTAPEDLCAFVGLKTVPANSPFPQGTWGHRICLVVCCFNGPEEEGRKSLAPLLAALPPPALDWTGMMPYPALQTMFDGLYPKGMQWYWKGDYVNELTDAAIDAHIAQAARTPKRTVARASLSDRRGGPSRRQTGNGVERQGRRLVDGHRRHRSKPAESRSDHALGESLLGRCPSLQSRRRLHQLHDGRRGRRPDKAAYGDNYGRLASIKAKYDPANLFHVNQNIRRGRSEPVFLVKPGVS